MFPVSGTCSPPSWKRNDVTSLLPLHCDVIFVGNKVKWFMAERVKLQWMSLEDEHFTIPSHTGMVYDFPFM